MLMFHTYYFWVWNNTDVISSWSCNCQLFELVPYLPVSCVSYQVVVKTKADYDGESKKGKLRSPKIAEFSISIIEGVSERLKVRTMSLPSSASLIDHPISNISHTPPHVHISQRADSSLCAAQDICHSHRNILLQSMLWSCLLTPPSSPASCAACFLVWATPEDIMHNDSLNPALKLSLIQLLPWRWPLNGSIPPACFCNPPHLADVFSCIAYRKSKTNANVTKSQSTVPDPHLCGVAVEKISLHTY